MSYRLPLISSSLGLMEVELFQFVPLVSHADRSCRERN